MSNFSDDSIKKKIHQDIQSIKDLSLNLSIKVANFNKIELHDSDIQIKSSHNDLVLLNQIVAKYTSLSFSNNIEAFVDLKKYKPSNGFKSIKDESKDESKDDSKDDSKDKGKDKGKEESEFVKNWKSKPANVEGALINIEVKHFMYTEELNEFDFENGFKVKKFKDYIFMEILPGNMVKLQNEGVYFYYCKNKFDEYKVPYLYHNGDGRSYFIGNNCCLYYVDGSNNLVVGEKCTIAKLENQ